jgi:GxxExxY protein
LRRDGLVVFFLKKVLLDLFLKPRPMCNNETLNKTGAIILDSCITVHRELGPGLLESAYELALRRELELRNVYARYQVPVELEYKGVNLGKAYCIDLLVEESIIIEIKSVEIMHPVFTAQIITYLKLMELTLGYLVNFNVPLLKDGFKRVVYNF